MLPSRSMRASTSEQTTASRDRLSGLPSRGTPAACRGDKMQGSRDDSIGDCAVLWYAKGASSSLLKTIIMIINLKRRYDG